MDGRQICGGMLLPWEQIGDARVAMHIDFVHRITCSWKISTGVFRCGLKHNNKWMNYTVISTNKVVDRLYADVRWRECNMHNVPSWLCKLWTVIDIKTKSACFKWDSVKWFLSSTIHYMWPDWKPNGILVSSNECRSLLIVHKPPGTNTKPCPTGLAICCLLYVG